MTEDEKPRVLAIEAQTPRTGIWCELCALPSVIEIPLYRWADDGPHPMGTWARCTNRCSGDDE